MPNGCLALCLAVLSVPCLAKDSNIQKNIGTNPIKITASLTKKPLVAHDLVEVKFKNRSDKPIQIVEFEVELEALHGVASVRNYLSVLKAPLEPRKGTTSKFPDHVIKGFNVRHIRPIRVFFIDGSRWLDADQKTDKDSAEEFKELMSRSLK